MKSARKQPGPKRINRAYNDPGELGMDSCYPSAESRARDEVAAELCVQGPMGFHTLVLAMNYSADFLARVLRDPRFIETRYGWDIKPLPKEGSKYEHGDARTTARSRRTGSFPRGV